MNANWRRTIEMKKLTSKNPAISLLRCCGSGLEWLFAGLTSSGVILVRSLILYWALGHTPLPSPLTGQTRENSNKNCQILIEHFMLRNIFLLISSSGCSLLYNGSTCVICQYVITKWRIKGAGPPTCSLQSPVELSVFSLSLFMFSHNVW